MQVPLQTLRFTGGDDVRMGLVFFRKVSRIGVSYAWPEMLPGQWVFDRPAHLMFSNLKPRRLVEVLPSVTYSISQERADGDRWAAADEQCNVGASGKFGITSGITLDGTINPDFSQVESDAFQVQVNQRFPVFFSEKRPFFMEGMGLFNIAGTGGDGNMRTAVHTRRIIDPIFGSKMTGTIGKTTFGVLNAADDSPTSPPDAASCPTRNKIFTIGRATYALRRSDYVGGIFTHTYHDGRAQPRGWRRPVAQAVAAHRRSRRRFWPRKPASAPARPPPAMRCRRAYGYETRRWFASQIEHYDRDFQMDTAFYNRTGFTAGWSFGEINFYPKSAPISGSSAFTRSTSESRARRDPGRRRGLRQLRHPVQLHAPGFPERLPEPRLRTVAGHEVQRRQRHQFLRQHAGVRLAGVQWREQGSARRFTTTGRSVPGPVAVRRYRRHAPAEPAPHAEPRTSNVVRFDRAETGARVFSVDILNSRTTYQFDKHFLIDSSRGTTARAAGADGLPGIVRVRARHGVSCRIRIGCTEKGFGSVEPVPGLSIPVDPANRFLMINRGLFLKASYLRRF